MNKYKERAIEILEHHAIDVNSFNIKGKNYNLANDANPLVNAMCQLAEEVESNKTKKTITKWECNSCGFSDWSGNVSENELALLQCSNCGENEFHLVEEIIETTIKTYTKEQVEELLQKQRELCTEKANCKLIPLSLEDMKEVIGNNIPCYTKSNYNARVTVNKDSILNAKLNINEK